MSTAAVRHSSTRPDPFRSNRDFEDFLRSALTTECCRRGGRAAPVDAAPGGNVARRPESASVVVDLFFKDRALKSRAFDLFSSDHDTVPSEKKAKTLFGLWIIVFANHCRLAECLL